MTLCELCNNFGSVRIKYDLDSAKQHATTHFLQMNIIDENVSLDQILKNCFPVYEETNACRRAPRGRAKNASRQTLVDLCHSVFPRKRILHSPSHFGCAKCGVEYRVMVKKCLNTNAIIDHASSHLDENELYACRHCSHKYRTCAGVRNHLDKVHRINSINGHFEDKSHIFVKEISAQIKSCFGPNNKKTDLGGKWIGIASRIRALHKGSELAIERQLLCHQLTRKIKDRNHSVKCRLCSSRVSVQHGKCVAAMQHVVWHLRKPTMRCRICSEAFVSRYKLQGHLSNVHSLPMANNCDCLADEFHSEIMNLLEKCYGTNADGNTIGDTIAPNVERGVLHSKGSRLSVERKLLCHRLIRKFGTHEKQLQCRLCSKWISGKSMEIFCKTDGVLQHALRHMAKPLFQCKQCPMTFTCTDNIVHHLRMKHALPFDQNHVCSQDEHQSEILAVLRECYGDERVKVKQE